MRIFCSLARFGIAPSRKFSGHCSFVHISAALRWSDKASNMARTTKLGVACSLRAILWEAGADVLLFETQPSLGEAKIEAAIAERLGADYWISFSCLSENIICEGTPIAECATTFAKGYPHLKMIGVNCTKPEYITGLIHKIKENCDIPIGVYPNSGEEYDAVKKVWFGKQSALSFEQYAYNYMKSGASAVGGCCTTVAKHVEEVVRAKKRFSEEQK